MFKYYVAWIAKQYGIEYATDIDTFDTLKEAQERVKELRGKKMYLGTLTYQLTEGRVLEQEVDMKLEVE